MRINHNIAALNTYRQLTANTSNTSKSLEKLSSGLRVNRAGDDAAGLAISEKMRGQIRGLDQASRNASDGISLIQTAEGALNETHSILQRMRELAVQASTDTNTESDRGEIQKEINELLSEVNRIANDTEFNTQKLLDGSFAKAGTPGTDAPGNVGTGTSLTFHIGANKDQNVKLNIGRISVSDLGELNAAGTAINATNALSTIGTGTMAAVGTTGTANYVAEIGANANAANSLLTQEGANRAIKIVDDSIKIVSAERSKLGAMQNRLEHTINNLGTASENLSASESRIRDVDMAKEMMEFTKNNILSQASQAMLAQANSQPQSVLQLLQ